MGILLVVAIIVVYCVLERKVSNVRKELLEQLNKPKDFTRQERISSDVLFSRLYGE